MDNVKRVCPVCGTEVLEGEDRCRNRKCRWGDLNRIFTNEEDYREWVRNELNPYIEQYRRKNGGSGNSTTSYGMVSSGKTQRQSGSGKKEKWKPERKKQQKKQQAEQQKQGNSNVSDTGKTVRENDYDESYQNEFDADLYECRDWYPKQVEVSPGVWRYEHWQHSAPSDYDSKQMRKTTLTNDIEQAKAEGDYKRVMALSNQLAGICRSQNLEQDAHWVEDGAFLFAQTCICREADIPLDVFDGKVPFVEILKDRMTKEADMELARGNYAGFAAYKQLNARICRVQGQEDNAYMLECSVSQYSKMADKMRERENISRAEQERRCLKSIVKKYGKELYKQP